MKASSLLRTRSPSGYRLCSQEDVTKLDLVRTLRNTGVGLGTIRAALARDMMRASRASPGKDADDARFRAGLRERFQRQDPRASNYWELVTILNGRHEMAGQVEDWKWVVASISHHLSLRWRRAGAALVTFMKTKIPALRTVEDPAAEDRTAADRTVERRLILRTMASAATVALAGCGNTAARPAAHTEPSSDEREKADARAEVTPGEDLMQEHGVLERILLVYEQAARRIEAGKAVDPSLIAGAASIVRHFVEEYHEKLEEQFVFPRLEAAHREVELVGVLKRQHERGRDVTKEIARLSNAGTAPAELVSLMRSFSRMYRPHASREDTVLFPAFRGVIGAAAYRELGEAFEEQEHSRFGEGGFERTVADVAELEEELGIADLASFTP